MADWCVAPTRPLVSGRVCVSDPMSLRLQAVSFCECRFCPSFHLFLKRLSAEEETQRETEASGPRCSSLKLQVRDV